MTTVDVAVSQAGERSGRPKIYVASPLGFATTTVLYYQSVLLPRLVEAGLEPLDPWRDDDGSTAAALIQGSSIESKSERQKFLAELAYSIGAKNEALIDQSDALLAVLDGTDVDSGTAAEIGYAAARGKPIIGLRTDFRRTGEIEGCTVNLQVEYFIVAGGGQVTVDIDGAVAALKEVLSHS